MSASSTADDADVMDGADGNAGKRSFESGAAAGWIATGTPFGGLILELLVALLMCDGRKPLEEWVRLGQRA